MNEAVLYVRDGEGKLVKLESNEYRERYDKREGKWNIIASDRQVRITTWLAAQAFRRLMDGQNVAIFISSYALADRLYRIMEDFAVNLSADERGGLALTSQSQRMVKWKSGGELNIIPIDAHAPVRGKIYDAIFVHHPGRASQSAVHQLFGTITTKVDPENGYIAIEESLDGGEGVEFWRIWNDAEHRGFTKHMLGC